MIKAVKTLCEYGKYFQKETEKFGFKSINTENGFNKQINAAVDYLVSRKQKKDINKDIKNKKL
ncbi:MAG: hypothetical protein KAS78_06490 [Candidatus Pacebacteria bacterium]|nr:hypothetical protein [Candidatus Paceibacterota bacterium]